VFKAGFSPAIYQDIIHHFFSHPKVFFILCEPVQVEAAFNVLGSEQIGGPDDGVGLIIEHLGLDSEMRPHVKIRLLVFRWNAREFLDRLKENDIHALSLDPRGIRFVTHLDFTEEMVEKVEKVLKDRLKKR